MCLGFLGYLNLALGSASLATEIWQFHPEIQAFPPDLMDNASSARYLLVFVSCGHFLPPPPR
ncbi:MAG: hypothetical protein CMQ07_09530, partial [Gammaproteobacteria bacterium]|nr:hypothetical protein [Gammaproteobacteria bacterium]